MEFDLKNDSTVTTLEMKRRSKTIGAGRSEVLNYGKLSNKFSDEGKFILKMSAFWSNIFKIWYCKCINTVDIVVESKESINLIKYSGRV